MHFTKGGVRSESVVKKTATEKHYTGSDKTGAYTQDNEPLLERNKGSRVLDFKSGDLGVSRWENGESGVRFILRQMCQAAVCSCLLSIYVTVFACNMSITTDQGVGGE